MGKHINLRMTWDDFFLLTCFYSLAGKKKWAHRGWGTSLLLMKGERQEMGHMGSVSHPERNTRAIHAMGRKIAYDKGPEMQDDKDKLY